MTRAASLLLALALAAGPRATAAAPRLAVVSLSAPAHLVYLGKQVAQVVAQAAERSGAYKVAGPESVERRLGRGRTRRLVECGGLGSCAAERVAALKVERVVSGVLSQSERNYQVTLALVEVRTGREITSFTRDIPIASRRLLAEVAAAAPAFLRGEPDAAGTLMVLTEEPGAETVVDGRWAGTTPFTLTVKPGKHQVLVRRPGFVEQEPHWVEVHPRDVYQDQVILHPIPRRDVPPRSGAAEAAE